MKKILLAFLLTLFAAPAFAQATYPTPAGSRVNGVVPLGCDVNGANCAPSTGAAGAASGTIPGTTVGGTTRALNYLWDTTVWDRSLGVQTPTGTAVAQVPVATSASAAGLVSIFRVDAGANLQAKATGGNLYDWSVTTGAVAGYVLVYNRASAPPEGAVTGNGLVDCVAVAANTTVSRAYAIPELFSTGIWLNFSSTGCFTQTSSSTAFIRARIR